MRSLMECGLSYRRKIVNENRHFMVLRDECVSNQFYDCHRIIISGRTHAKANDFRFWRGSWWWVAIHVPTQTVRVDNKIEKLMNIRNVFIEWVAAAATGRRIFEINQLLDDWSACQARFHRISSFFIFSKISKSSWWSNSRVFALIARVELLYYQVVCLYYQVELTSVTALSIPIESAVS